MKRLVTSDWQLCNNPRDRYRTDFVVNEIPKLIEKYKPDQLLVLGDVTEQKDNHPAALVNEIVNLFYNLQKKSYVIILEGNHDFLHKEHPYFRFISKFDNVEWISKPIVLDKCLYLPHTRDYKTDWKGIDFKGHDFIFAHNIFEGVKANGQKLSGIPLNVFSSDSFCISGDVHEPQILRDEAKNITCVYVGAPYLCDFGDQYQPRVLLLDDLNVKSIKVGGPQKRVIVCNWDWEDSTFHGEIHEGDIVKLKVNLEMQHVAEWDKIRQLVVDLAITRKLVVNSVLPIVAYVQGERAKPVKAMQKSDEQYLSDFVKRTGIDDRTAAVGKDLMES